MFALFPVFRIRTLAFSHLGSGQEFLIWTQGEIHPVNRAHVKMKYYSSVLRYSCAEKRLITCTAVSYTTRYARMVKEKNLLKTETSRG